jgi:glycosyltransferase involved in cell wall biosynthesis
VVSLLADGQTGFIVSSVDELAAAVDRVGELNPKAMRARVEQRFSAEAMVVGYEGVYQRVRTDGGTAHRVHRS